MNPFRLKYLPSGRDEFFGTIEEFEDFRAVVVRKLVLRYPFDALTLLLLDPVKYAENDEDGAITICHRLTWHFRRVDCLHAYARVSCNYLQDWKDESESAREFFVEATVRSLVYSRTRLESQHPQDLLS